MKKLMKKKINVFGKEISVFMIALIGAMVLVSAALIPYFGLITGTVTVTQGLLVDGLSMPASGNIQDSYSGFTSLQNPTYVEMHNLTNNANVQANGSITSDCSAGSTNCTGVDYRAVEYFDNAGADFSGYTHPACTTTISSGIQTAINNANTGDVVCVDAGTYAGDVNINKDITLVALDSPNSTNKATITGVVSLSVAGATLKGFDIFPGTISGKYGVYVTTGDTTIDSNIIRDITGNGLVSIDGIYVYNTTGANDINITNNLIQNLVNTGKGANGVMIQGHLDGVNVTYNTIKDIATTNTTLNYNNGGGSSYNASWDYAMGIQDTPTGNWVGSPKNLVIKYNTLDNITSVKEPGRGFGVDLASTTNYANADEVTLKYNNFLNISNVLTNKDLDTTHTLVALDNFFDKLTYNVNGIAKNETGAIDADWMNKTNFSIAPNGVDKFATLAAFQKMLKPDTFTVTTTVTA